MEYQELAEELLHTLIFASNLRGKKRINEIAKGEKFIICYLYQHEKALPGEIAGQMRTTTAHVAKMLRSLDERGIVSRTLDETDRRRILVSLTDKGKEVAKSYAEEVTGMLEKLLMTLGEQDAEDYVRITKKVVGVLNQQVF